MLRQAVLLDAAMSVRQAVRRLAEHGYWLTAESREVNLWLGEYVSRIRSIASDLGVGSDGDNSSTAGRASGDPVKRLKAAALSIADEPYVPWELALVDPVLDPTRPKFLGAQVAMGRWILGDAAIASPPRRVLSIRGMAVMVGMYNVTTGLRPLPQAIAEAKELAKLYETLPVIPLDSTAAALKSLLDASLTFKFDAVGGVDAVHFAGHGDVDPTRPGDAAIYLSNGKPLSPLFFRHSKLGQSRSPFIFLNACMVGSGGQVLGDYGGFPGNCLAGGFCGLVAPLWTVNDEIAKSVALEFYRMVLEGPPDRSVAEILRDLRANYKNDDPMPSYLAYVYYGNPHLQLTRSAATVPAGP